LLISVKKVQKMLIFTLIFELKTNKSYKITLLTITSHPIFQNFLQKPDSFKNLPQKNNETN